MPWDDVGATDGRAGVCVRVRGGEHGVSFRSPLLLITPPHIAPCLCLWSAGSGLFSVAVYSSCVRVRGECDAGRAGVRIRVPDGEHGVSERPSSNY